MTSPFLTMYNIVEPVQAEAAAAFPGKTKEEGGEHM